MLNKQLIGQKFVAGEYSIADMAILPWILRYEWQGIQLEDYPYVQEYIVRLTARPAVQKRYLLKSSKFIGRVMNKVKGDLV